MQYRKIFKWLLIVLFIAGLVTAAFGFFNGWPDAKEWKNDQKLVEELPDVIADLKEMGAEELTSAELEQRKAEIDSLTAVAMKCSERSTEIASEIDGTKSKSKKVQLEAKYKAELDSLTKEITTINSAINVYNSSNDLQKTQAQLDEVKARIETGNESANTILYSTYIMMMLVLLVLVVVAVVNWINNPWNILKNAIMAIAICVVVGGIWMLAPGSELHSAEYYQQMGTVAPDAGTLKMTDAILYLAYLMIGGTVLALLISWIVGATRK